MVTYLLLNLVFIIALILFLRIPVGIPGKKRLIITGVLLLLTIVFDSMIVGFGLVAYDPDRILGLRLVNAPIEDLFYSVLAVVLIPFLWQLFERKK